MNSSIDDSYNFTTMSFNVRFGRANDGLNNWEIRKPRVVACIQKYSPDFIGIQELNDFQTAYIQENCKDYKYIGEKSSTLPFWQNNVIFYHHSWHCQKDEHFFLSPTPTIPSRYRKSKWPRQCTLGLFSRFKKKIAIFNTHFDFESDIQTKSARLMLDRTKKIRGNYPVVVLGDFNTVPGSDAYNVFTVQPDIETRFLDAFAGNEQSTHHQYSGVGKGGQIDWILYTPDLKLIKNMHVHDQFYEGYPSDHFPIIAQFAWL